MENLEEKETKEINEKTIDNNNIEEQTNLENLEEKEIKEIKEELKENNVNDRIIRLILSSII